MDGWGKVLAGVVIGVAGAVYATNEDLRKRLPKTARDLPDNMRRRFDSAVSHAGRGTQVEIKQEPGAAEPTADEVGPSPRAGD